MMVLVNRLLVLDLIRARLCLCTVDDWYWPMLDDCRHDGKRGELRRRRRQDYGLWHEIHHEWGGERFAYMAGEERL